MFHVARPLDTTALCSMALPLDTTALFRGSATGHHCTVFHGPATGHHCTVFHCSATGHHCTVASFSFFSSGIYLILLPPPLDVLAIFLAKLPLSYSSELPGWPARAYLSLGRVCSFERVCACVGACVAHTPISNIAGISPIPPPPPRCYASQSLCDTVAIYRAPTAHYTVLPPLTIPCCHRSLYCAATSQYTVLPDELKGPAHLENVKRKISS